MGDRVTLDGSASYDDVQPSGNLKYSWDTDGDGTFDAGKRTVVHIYKTPGKYTATLKVTDAGGLSSTDNVTVTVRGSDLRVSNITSAQNGGQITLTATVTNFGPGKAAATKTRFVRDGSTQIATVDTPALPSGQSANVVATWNLNGQTGQHVITVTADATGLVGETNETNNSATKTVTIQ